MPSRPLAVVVLAAGQGTRMKSRKPKVAFEICGWPIVRHVVEATRPLKPDHVVVVVGHEREVVEKCLEDVKRVNFAAQRQQRGTADAVKCGLKDLAEFEGDVLVLCGDVPLVRGEILKELLTSHRRRKESVTVLSAELRNPASYGRIIRSDRGEFLSIREARDCNDDELTIREINTGIMIFDAAQLRRGLRRVTPDNDQAEYYLTDVPSILRELGEKVQAVPCATPDEVLGVNTFEELAAAATKMRMRILGEWMAKGVHVVDPATTFVDRQVQIGRATRILPCTVIEGDVVIGEYCEVGPFSHVRPGTVLKDRAEVGNFVETKKAVLGEGTKAKHLTYLGDARIGAGVNVGCGTITANYDGKNKHVTVIEDGVHIGSGTVLVAPVTVGRDATTGAGAIVTAGRDVAPGDVVVGVPARSLSASRPGGKQG